MSVTRKTRATTNLTPISILILTHDSAQTFTSASTPTHHSTPSPLLPFRLPLRIPTPSHTIPPLIYNLLVLAHRHAPKQTATSLPSIKLQSALLGRFFALFAEDAPDSHRPGFVPACDGAGAVALGVVRQRGFLALGAVDFEHFARGAEVLLLAAGAAAGTVHGGVNACESVILSFGCLCREVLRAQRFVLRVVGTGHGVRVVETFSEHEISMVLSQRSVFW